MPIPLPVIMKLAAMAAAASKKGGGRGGPSPQHGISETESKEEAQELQDLIEQKKSLMGR